MSLILRLAWPAAVLLAVGCSSPGRMAPEPPPAPSAPPDSALREAPTPEPPEQRLRGDLALGGDDPARGLFERAWSEFETDPETAFSIAERALKISSNKMAGYLNYARMLERAGRIADALQFARRALAFTEDEALRDRVQRGWIDRLSR
ncbi:MAG: hypothetical protein ISN29_12200 [Gammaproteobacteria bacterium AqS3]|nr:hypothetical protein [Gammaproteobacteria bacterium AqS3]